MYIIDHIPKGNKRPRLPMSPEFITIHGTGNPKSTAKNERNWLVNPINFAVASWHIAVDEKEAVEAIPLNEVAWHAGDGKNGTGNRKSIGIEICESGNREVVIKNAIKLTANLLHRYGLSVDKVKQHYDWNKKDCPKILRIGFRWRDFLTEVQKELDVLNKEEINWKLIGLKELHEAGLVQDFEGWSIKIEESLPAWATFTVLNNLYKKLKG